jgi:hypothetical protein
LDREGPFGPKLRWLCAHVIEVALNSSATATTIFFAVMNRTSLDAAPLKTPAVRQENPGHGGPVPAAIALSSMRSCALFQKSGG